MKQGRIVPLPHWVLTNYQSAFYDDESGTVLQALARIYPKVEDFTNGLINDFDCFKSCIIKTMDDYIESIDTKMSVQDTLIADKFREQDTKIDNAIKYMKDNIIATTNSIINQAIENGELNVGLEYNPSDESLNFIVTREGD